MGGGSGWRVLKLCPRLGATGPPSPATGHGYIPARVQDDAVEAVELSISAPGLVLGRTISTPVPWTGDIEAGLGWRSLDVALGVTCGETGPCGPGQRGVIV